MSSARKLSFFESQTLGGPSDQPSIQRNYKNNNKPSRNRNISIFEPNSSALTPTSFVPPKEANPNKSRHISVFVPESRPLRKTLVTAIDENDKKQNKKGSGGGSNVDIGDNDDDDDDDDDGYEDDFDDFE